MAKQAHDKKNKIFTVHKYPRKHLRQRPSSAK